MSRIHHFPPGRGSPNLGRVDENLVERRCLGQTELKVKPGQVGTTNATKPDNLGVLDYAHLRVPLPRDLSNSGIFVKQANRKWPEAYFLMVRENNGWCGVRSEDRRLTANPAALERRLHQCYRHVQGCLSVGATGRGSCREGLYQVARQHIERRGGRQCLDTPRSRCVFCETML